MKQSSLKALNPVNVVKILCSMSSLLLQNPGVIVFSLRHIISLDPWALSAKQSILIYICIVLHCMSLKCLYTPEFYQAQHLNFIYLRVIVHTFHFLSTLMYSLLLKFGAVFNMLRFVMDFYPLGYKYMWLYNEKLQSIDCNEMDGMFWDLEGDCNKYFQHPTEKIKFSGYVTIKISVLFCKKFNYPDEIHECALSAMSFQLSPFPKY